MQIFAKNLMILVILHCVYNTAYAGAQEQEQEKTEESAEWELVKNSHGVTLYFRDYPDSKIPEFKAVTTIESSMASIIALLLDSEACSEWVHQCERSHTIAMVSPSEQYVYQRNKLPLVRDRDIILHAVLVYELNEILNAMSDTKINDKNSITKVSINLTAAPHFCDNSALATCEEVNASNSVHITDAIGSYQLTEISPNITEVIWQQYVDPAGYLPNWLAKSQLVDLPVKTLHALKHLVKDEKYQNNQLIIDATGLHIVKTPFDSNPTQVAP